MIEKVNGGWRAKIIADSISTQGKRLTTMEVRFPRMVLAEFNTHRMFSRNSASSRAIPVEKMIAMVEEDPFIPTYWGKNQKGMQASSEIDEPLKRNATIHWLEAAEDAVLHAQNLLKLGIHKQIANRLLEPFMWHVCIVSATEWDNFFALRCDAAAAPEIRSAALLMRDAYAESQPMLVQEGQWHLPYISSWDWQAVKFFSAQPPLEYVKQISVARCARVSYLTHDGKRDLEADMTLYERLRSAPHLSPFEHVATPVETNNFYGNFYGNFEGWKQYRKFIPNESNAALLHNYKEQTNV